MTKEQLLEKANDLPLAPGVYLMMDASGKVIYVGKAKKLKNRVSQYFQLGTGHNEKTRRMVSQVDHFDTIFVSSEFEALILENSLIKQHQPHYNILLKDDKGYPFVRLSHGPLAERAPWLESLRRAETAEGVSCELLIDLQGPELRVGALFAPLTLREGDTLTLGEAFPVPPILTGNLQDGDELLLDDGALSLRVLDARAMTCRVERGGVLRSRKSLAVAGRELPASALTEMDMENLSRAREYGVTALMQPFVRGADDLRAVRAALRETGAQELKIFAKIENMTGLHRLDEILPLADVVVIARGDLGNAMPLWELPRAQTLIARKCRAAKRPFMVSTQMLHSMHHAAVPTRAEVTDVYQAARSGADYLLLTGETAVGEYPVEAMTYFAKIAANGWADAE